MVQASGKDASWSPLYGGVPVTSSWEEAPGQTQVQVERFYLYAGLGTPRNPLVRVGRCGQRKGSLGPPAETARNPTLDKRLTMDGWMDGWTHWLYLFCETQFRWKN